MCSSLLTLNDSAVVAVRKKTHTKKTTKKKKKKKKKNQKKKKKNQQKTKKKNKNKKQKKNKKQTNKKQNKTKQKQQQQKNKRPMGDNSLTYIFSNAMQQSSSIATATWTQIWPYHKKIKGNPSLIILTNLVDLETPMPYTKVQPQSFLSTGEEDF